MDLLDMPGWHQQLRTPMRIAVIADTHDKVPPRLPGLLAGADEIWHLGDVCEPATLEVFSSLGKPLKLVRGNCDAVFEWPLTLDFSMGGLQIRLVHIPPSIAPPGTQLLLHGHTHVPRNERIGKATFLNPGCITRPNRGAPRSFAWLEFHGAREYSWKLDRFE
jgi:uncharacterized protein